MIPVGQYRLVNGVYIGESITDIDLTALNSTAAIDVPYLPGMKVVGVVGRFLWTVVPGGGATTNALLTAGNNGTFDNLFIAAALTITTTNINAAVVNGTILASIAANAVALDPVTPIQTKVTQVAGGLGAGTAKGRLVLSYGLLPT